MNSRKLLFIVVGLLFCQLSQSQTITTSFEYLCSGEGDTTIFTGKYIGNKSFISFTWEYGDNVLSSDMVNPSSKIHKYDIAGSYEVKLTVLLFDSVIKRLVKDSVVVPITVYPEPIYDFTFDGDTTFYEDKNVTMTVDGTTLDSILWSTGDVNNTTLTVNTENVYSVTGIDDKGCRTDKSVVVTVLDINDLIPTTLFTPEKNGYNDYWHINNIGGYGFISVVVFNKYGEEVYSNSTYNNDWDGTYNDKELPAETYYYIIKTNKEKIYKGAVNILR